MKRLQKEFEEVQAVKRLSTEPAHTHDLPQMSDSLAVLCAENAKLKYQLNVLQRVRCCVLLC
jgi:hypothetical protein